MAIHRAAKLAAFFFLLLTVPLAAQDVTLTSPDGSVEINGTLLGFDGDFYRVETIYGELTVDGTGVNCAGPACPDLQNYVAQLSVSGSATIGEVLMPALIEGFALQFGYVAERTRVNSTHFTYSLRNKADQTLLGTFEFRVTNTDEGFADLLADEADIVMSLREIRLTENRRATEAGLGDLTGQNRSRVLALDAMVAITAPGNPVDAISPAVLARVFAGRVTNWSQLGGPDAPISVHLRDPKSGLSQAVQDRLMAPAGLVLDSRILRHPTNKALTQAVTNDPFAIGISSYSETGNTDVLVLTGTCGFSLRAGRVTIKTEDYPLTAPMFLYIPARRLPQLAREFLTYTRSPSAQIVIRRAGFVDQAPEELSINQQGDRFANAISLIGTEIDLSEVKRLVEVLSPMKRLSTSFRFRAGSSALDAQSLSNVQQLARAIETGVYDERAIKFVGFSDGQGSADTNHRIAQQRAHAVLAAVKQAAETVDLDELNITVDAFGEALPMACDDSAWGRQVNRRVEVWVR
ncbi:phosphate ABC transporter substrate-binding/OmpA family protein [Planktotalea arctica]|uniref:phosphate ABC transporter substrate-binding/OmpA family protein n=1 Tax=Planktotalea arctica TaxID=1481893 RepID=UPI003219C1ED